MSATEKLDACLCEADEKMHEQVSQTKQNLARFPTGRASSSMLSGLSVEHAGKSTPLDQAATITIPDQHTLVLTPHDEATIPDIQKVIDNAKLAASLKIDGKTLRLSMSALNEEQKQESLKKAKSEIEIGKVGIRALRRDYNGTVSKLVADGLTEEEARDASRELQECADKQVAELDEIFKHWESLTYE
jgi:ribosome recycling factor